MYNEPNPDRSALDPQEEASFEAGLKALEMAKKHGYYYSVLGEQQRIDYVMALAHDDEDEIALLESADQVRAGPLSLQLLSVRPPARHPRTHAEGPQGSLDARGQD